MASSDLTVRVDVQPFMNGEPLTAERLNMLVAKVNELSGATVPGLLLESEPNVSVAGVLGGMACAAVARNPRLSRRALLGLRACR